MLISKCTSYFLLSPQFVQKKKSNKEGFHVKYHTYFPICCKVTIRRFSTTQTSSTLTPQLSKPMKGTLEQRSPTGARLYIQFNYNSTSRDTKLKWHWNNNNLAFTSACQMSLFKTKYLKISWLSRLLRRHDLK